MQYVPRVYHTEIILATAVADSGTFEVGYPAGTNQTRFLYQGVAANQARMIVDYNDKYTAALGQMSVVFGASTITVTNSTGVTLPASSRVMVIIEEAASTDVLLIATQNVPLAQISTSRDVLSFARPNFTGLITFWEAQVVTPATTAGGDITFNLEIGSTNVTGGTIQLTTANVTPQGQVRGPSTIISGNNRMVQTDVLSIEAVRVGSFTEGEVQFNVYGRRDQFPDAY